MRNTDTYSWTSISPEVWESLMKAEAAKLARRVVVERITVEAYFQSYCAILNPYGGVYPESDLAQFGTLGRVFDYVDTGGVFINVADVPGYYAYSKTLRRRLETTPVVFAPQPTPGGGSTLAPMYPYQLTPFLQRLGMRVVGVERTPLANVTAVIGGQFAHLVGAMQGTWLAHRVAFLERNLDSVIVPAAAGPGNLVSPLLYAKMGQGTFLLSLLPLDQPQNAGVPSLMCRLTVAQISR
ncbi:MAG TPA: hypothetical protein VGR25_13730 [bacterium]|nr:hypothetical protein [bacterium]